MKRHLCWLIPIALWLNLVPFTPHLDMAFESYFYQEGHFSNAPLYTNLYKYGPILGNAVAIISFLLFLGSFVFTRLKTYRLPGLYLALVMAIGSGLIVNVILKDHWGQPRPKQVVEFGGKQEYRPIWKPNFSPPEPSKAFPCGHCAMGFYFFAPALLAWHLGRKKLFWALLLFALIFGGLLSLTRMAQGGHFFSDVITSALIMWLVSLWLLPILPDRAQSR